MRSQNTVNVSNPCLLTKSKVLFGSLLFTVFLLALGLRMYEGAEHAVEFQYVRQYHSALLARSLYYKGVESIPDWRRRVIQATAPRVHEPPVMEWLSVFGYRVIGSEELWIPRFLACIFWLIGGIPLYVLLRRFFNSEITLLCVLFYLLVPYGVYLSLSFQPDSLMLMMMLFSILGLVRYHEDTTRTRLVIASVITAMTLLIKPVALFLILGVFFSLALLKEHPSKLLLKKSYWLFILIGLGPAAFYYVYHILNGGALSGVAQKSILPGLLLHPFYYKGWLYQLERVVGFPFLVASLIGTLMFKQREGKFLAWGLWLGYFCFGLVFTWPFTTHAYYHIVAVPIICLCLGPLFEQIAESLRSSSSRLVRPAFLGILVFVIAITVIPVIGSIQHSDYLKKVAVYEEIGKKVGHSTRTVFLAAHEGEPLMYHGWLAGKKWPGAWSFRREKYGLIEMTDFQDLKRRIDVGAVKKRFKDDYEPDNPEYFIITNFDEFKNQPDLKEFLTTEFSLLAQTKHYMIFDLRSKIGV
jgi:hypothetical protein